MWKQSFLLTISGAHLALALSGTGHSTRYWDCCKPSCSWSNKVTGAVTVTSPVKSCDKNDNVLASPDVTSGCQSGSSFACSNNSPWAVNDSLAYGFAATEITGAKEQDTCCACFK
ncbi:hypothetical protein VHEMI08281 [[Torrubiella] hemipterigena]|uniref:Cellulase n=1 Tax=[Torrubiella] hemipterigena TaxID=1531966 RepID=A0A0A1TN78_9HYPO|nr:hypothetical protein VHEMI08281 [[Torrubiella] hemipterigena]